MASLSHSLGNESFPFFFFFVVCMCFAFNSSNRLALILMVNIRRLFVSQIDKNHSPAPRSDEYFHSPLICEGSALTSHSGGYYGGCTYSIPLRCLFFFFWLKKNCNFVLYDSAVSGKVKALEISISCRINYPSVQLPHPAYFRDLPLGFPRHHFSIHISILLAISSPWKSDRMRSYHCAP